MNANRVLKKKIIQSTAVALSVAALSAGAYQTAASVPEVTYEPTGYVTAGIITELSVMESQAFEAAKVSVDEAKVTTVAASEKKTGKWDNRIMADVDDYLYIRKTARKDGEIVGKLRRGDVAEIVSEKGSWTKIKSGDVTGYVKTKYCAEGIFAKALYKSLDLDGISTAISVEEEQALGQIAVLAKAEQAAAAAEAAETAAAETSVQETEAAAPETTQNQAVQASVDDVTLLANLIWCEAGGESYDGQLAVGAVVVNRLNAGYASSISGVIYQPYQFGPASSGKLASAIASGSASSSCIQAAQEALSGVSNIGTAKNFHRANGTAGTVIGNHVFF